MSNFENGSPKIRRLPKSTQLFEKMFDEVVNCRIIDRTNIPSMNLEIFELSPISYDDESVVHKNQSDKERIENTSIIQLSQDPNTSDSTLKYEIEKYEGDLSVDNEPYPSTQHSRCSECRFNSLLTSVDNTPHQTQSNRFLPTITETFDIIVRDDDNLDDKKRFLRKRCFSVSPETNSSEFCTKPSSPSHYNLKKFKSEGNVATFKNIENNLSIMNKPATITEEISIRNSKSISQTTEPFANDSSSELLPRAENADDIAKYIKEFDRKYQTGSYPEKNLTHISTQRQICSEDFEYTERIDNSPIENTALNMGEIPIDRNTSTVDDNSSHNSMNEVISSQNKSLNEIDSILEDSMFSENTIEEIYWIGVDTDIGCSNSDKSIDKEMQEASCLHLDDMTSSRSSIHEIHCSDASNDIVSSTGVKMIIENTEYQTAKVNAMRSLNNDEIIQDGKVMDTETTELRLRPLINSLPDAMNMRENILVDLSFGKDLQSKKDDLEVQCRTVTEMKRNEKEDNVMAVSVHFLDNPVKENESAKDEEFGNDRTLIGPDDSILEITIESDLDQIVRKEAIIGGEINSVNVVNNLKTDFVSGENLSKDEKITMNKTHESIILDTNNSLLENITPSKAISAKNVDATILPEFFDPQFLANCGQLKNIEKQLNEMETRNYHPINSVIDPDGNISSKKDLDTISPGDMSLEFLSESQLQRIEDEAYVTVNKARAHHLNGINARNDVTKEDVFYRPQQLNMITEKSNDYSVLPNWVTNPVLEPDYEKMKRAVQMRREYIKKMLNEILRLSTIVSKVQDVLNTQHEKRDSEAAHQDISRFQNSRTMNCTENNRTSEFGELEAPGSSKNNSTRENVSKTVNVKHEDVFYLPQSSRSTFTAPSNIIGGASVNLVTNNNYGLRKDEMADGRFYVPQSNAPQIFNRSKDIKFNKNDICNNMSYMQSNASSLFGSLKQDFNTNKTCEPDASSPWYSSKKIESGIFVGNSNSNAILKNKEKIVGQIDAGYLFRDIGFNAKAYGKNKTALNANKVELVNNDAIFYSPDQLSSASNIQKILPSETKNGIFFSKNVTNRQTNRVGFEDQKTLNLRPNLFPSDSNGIFYNGNK